MNVYPALFASFGCFDALAIQNACARFWLTSIFDTHGPYQLCIDALPQAVFLPAPKVAINRLPGWQVGGQHSPLTAGADDIQDRIHDLPHFPFPGTAQLMGWKKVRNQHPFGILEVSRVGLGEFGHSPILPDHLRNALLQIVGQSHLIGSREDFEQVVIVPGCLELLGMDTAFGCLLLF